MGIFYRYLNVLFIVILVYISFEMNKSPVKHIFDSGIHLHLGTKTPYRFVENLDTNQYIYNGCTPIKIWHIIRHGTRTPKTKLIRTMKTLLNNLKNEIVLNIDNNKGELSSDVKPMFDNWKLDIEDSDSQILTSEGKEELLQLGRRMRLRLPDLYLNGYSNYTYKFRYTATQRTQESANQFSIGLFGKEVEGKVFYPEPLDKDPILRFYKLCEKWRKTVSKNPDTFIEQSKFGSSKEMEQTIQRVSKRLGLSSKLHVDDLFIMYQMCCYETAWSRTKLSPWCLVFSKEDVQVLEYYDDLKYYWRDGYGFPLNYKQACPAFNNMVEFFTSESLEPKGMFYFTHSGTLLKLMSFLELYKDDEKLLSSNYETQGNRKWNVSKIDAFGTNLAFVLYRCDDNSDKVLTLHQEVPVRIPGCPQNCDLCPLRIFLDIHKDSVDNCKFNEMCDNKK